MTLWRARVCVQDGPGRLAALAQAIAARGGNVLGLSVHHDGRRAVDEFFIDTDGPLLPGAERPEVTAEELVQALLDAGGEDPIVVRAAMHEMVDAATRAVLLADRVCGAPEELPRMLSELLNASEATWVAHTGRIAPDAVGGVEVVFPAWAGRAVRLRRDELPFTQTELARASAIVRLARHRVAGRRRQAAPPDDAVGAGPPTGAGAPSVADSERLLLADGSEVVLRRSGPDDLAAVLALHRRCSTTSRYHRYFSLHHEVPEAVLRRLVSAETCTLLAVDETGAVVAMANLVAAGTPGSAELAVLVEDAWQGRRLGTVLVRRLLRRAGALGVSVVSATVLPGNRRMLRIVERIESAVWDMADSGMVTALIPLTATVRTPDDDRPTPAGALPAAPGLVVTGPLRVAG